MILSNFYMLICDLYKFFNAISIQIFCPFLLGSLFCCIVRVFYIFWTLIRYKICENLFSCSAGCLLTFLRMHKSFEFWWSPLYLFSLSIPFSCSPTWNQTWLLSISHGAGEVQGAAGDTGGVRLPRPMWPLVGRKWHRSVTQAEIDLWCMQMKPLTGENRDSLPEGRDNWRRVGFGKAEKGEPAWCSLWKKLH